MNTKRKAITRSQASRALSDQRDALKQLGVKSLAIFGSVARDEAQPESDLDLVVEFEGAATYDRYMDVKFFLEDTLGRKIDLVVKNAIQPRMLKNVERDAIFVA